MRLRLLHDGHPLPVKSFDAFKILAIMYSFLAIPSESNKNFTLSRVPANTVANKLQVLLNTYAVFPDNPEILVQNEKSCESLLPMPMWQQ